MSECESRKRALKMSTCIASSGIDRGVLASLVLMVAAAVLSHFSTGLADHSSSSHGNKEVVLRFVRSSRGRIVRYKCTLLAEE